MNEQPKGNCKHGEFILTEGCPQCIAEERERREAKVEGEEPFKPAGDVPFEDHSLEDAAYEAKRDAAEPEHIVKVRYFSESTGKGSDREYTYFSVDPLKVGHVVQVPVRGDRLQKAVVTAIDVPESVIESYRHMVKTIASLSVFPDADPPNLDQTPPEPEAAPEAEPAQVPFLLRNAEPEPEADQEEPAGLAAAAEAAGAEVTEAKVEVVLEEEGAADATVIPEGTALVKIAPSSDPRVIALHEEVQGLLRVAQEREIKTNEDLEPAADDLAIIAKVTKTVNAKRAEYTKPISDRLDQVRDVFKTLLEPLAEADRINRGKVKEFDNEQRRKAAEAQRIEDEKFKLAQEEAALSGTGEHTQELGTAEVPPPVPERTRTDLGTLGGRINWKYEVLDFSLLPDQYKLPNTALLTSFAKTTKGTQEVPGVRIYSEKDVTMRTR